MIRLFRTDESMKLFKVAQPGFFTTVQDLGRHGFLRYGVPVSGAMDDFSLQLANMLVRNELTDACLEVTMLGPELEALKNTQIAITGGDLSPHINGQDVNMWQTLNVSSGDVVSFGKVRSGCRAYLSVTGGINVPLVLGSRSTYFRGEMGGVEGRRLRAEDIIEGFDSANSIDSQLSMPKELIPSFGREAHVKVLLGPQLENFTENAVETFLSNPYIISLEADRMGYRLDGPVIEHRTKGDIVSDAILSGAVQVPSNGMPIVTMRDAQTTGGYAKIAKVITSDLNVLGQAKPKDAVFFHETTLPKACHDLLEYRKKLEIIHRELVRRSFPA